MQREEVYYSLCRYDLRNPNYDAPDEDWDEVCTPRKDCCCDNCFYGRDRLAVALLEEMDKNNLCTTESREI